jgi:hypothetical protein
MYEYIRYILLSADYYSRLAWLFHVTWWRWSWSKIATNKIIVPSTPPKTWNTTHFGSFGVSNTVIDKCHGHNYASIEMQPLKFPVVERLLTKTVVPKLKIFEVVRTATLVPLSENQFLDSVGQNPASRTRGVYSSTTGCRPPLAQCCRNVHVVPNRGLIQIWTTENIR